MTTSDVKDIDEADGVTNPMAGDEFDSEEWLNRRCEWIETRSHGASLTTRASDLLSCSHGSSSPRVSMPY